MPFCVFLKITTNIEISAFKTSYEDAEVLQSDVHHWKKNDRRFETLKEQIWNQPYRSSQNFHVWGISEFCTFFILWDFFNSNQKIGKECCLERGKLYDCFLYMNKSIFVQKTIRIQEACRNRRIPILECTLFNEYISNSYK